MVPVVILLVVVVFCLLFLLLFFVLFFCFFEYVKSHSDEFSTRGTGCLQLISSKDACPKNVELALFFMISLHNN